jgi:peptidyl-prolyl cis-trans isomerase B (cyclophilin B)
MFRILKILTGLVFLLGLVACSGTSPVPQTNPPEATETDRVAVPLAAPAYDGPVFVRLTTEPGEMLGVFYPELAPNHVGSFVHLTNSGFYTGTTFHRIVPGFVIQGGDPNSKDMDPRNDGIGGPRISDVLNPEELRLLDQVNAMLEAKGYGQLDGDANLKAEFSKSAKHIRGTLSMARGAGLDTAGSQFFVCVDRTASLDGNYTIFGYVFKGMETADIIVGGEKNPAAGQDAPAIPIAILKAEIIEGVEGLRDDEKIAWDQVPAELRNVK